MKTLGFYSAQQQQQQTSFPKISLPSFERWSVKGPRKQDFIALGVLRDREEILSNLEVTSSLTNFSK